MEIYIVLVLLLLVMSFFKSNKVLFLVSTFFLIFLAGYREVNVGSDTINYFYIFKGRIEGSDLEFLFVWLLTFVEQVGGDFNFLLLILAILCVLPVSYVVYKTSNNVFYSLFVYTSLFFYFNSFNITRQSIAVSFCFLGYYFLDKKKLKSFIIAIIIGFLFHRSAIIAFILYPLLLVNVSKKLMYLITVLSLILSTTGVFTSLLTILGFFGEKYLAYSSLLDIKEGGIVTRLLLNVFLLTIIFLVKKIDIWLISMFIGVIVLNVLSFSPELGRLSQIFLIGQVVLFANLRFYVEKSKYFFLTFVVSIYCLSVFTVLLLSNSGEIVPYKMF
ncbi:EpsG family protein [Myroides odoratimimus]|uniref:EpsG family protein n=1 Tax=Myroides odoratimimus TaxID=76832 RepID=UPI0025770781|nr:EpsG family protein [Myroides odoratimimus]MDM1398177.1 EpsG family protein [Myroides odoratimimus]MEC4054522.1 EpsG family protein [Myroides odoratimimus]